MILPPAKTEAMPDKRRSSAGFSLLELVITLTVLTIMTLGVIPLIKTSVKRQREQQLRESLREMREAIKEFHRDTIACPVGLGGTQQQQQGQQQQQQQQQQGQQQQGQPQLIDPRSRVCISDQTIFTVDNTERYPPTLETLRDGVDVLPRFQSAANTFGGLNEKATEINKLQTTPKKKIYLRAIPIDPMTGKAEWDLRSVSDAPDTASWGGENVFDVHSKSDATSLNGEKYNEW